MMESTVGRFSVNLGLFVFAIASVFSGMLLQVNYHIGNHGANAIDGCVFGINYGGWSVIHKMTALVFFMLVIFHFFQHWKWYKAVFVRRLLAKNRQVLILSLVFVLTAISGLVPWCVGLLDGAEILRKIFIEIHDKLAIVLTLYLILHIIKRFRWFFTAVERIW